MIDNLEWAVDVLSGGYHARIKGTNKSYWITPHAAGFHEWTWEIFVGAALHRRGFVAWAEPWMTPRQSPSTTPLIAFEKERRRRESQRRKEEAARKKQPGRSSQEKAARKKQQERRDQAIAKAQAALTNAEPKHDNIVATIGAERNALEHKSQAENARWAKEKDRLERASPGARVAPGRRPLNCKEAIEPQAAGLLAPDAAHTAGHSVIG